MSKFFNKAILDDLEDRFDRWCKDPPPKFESVPDGGVFFIFLSNKPDEEITDTVFTETVNEMLTKPEHSIKTMIIRLMGKLKRKKMQMLLKKGAGDEIDDNFHDALGADKFESLESLESLPPENPETAIEIYEVPMDKTLNKILRGISTGSVILPTIFGPTIDEPITAIADYSYRLSSWVFKIVTHKKEPTTQVTEH